MSTSSPPVNVVTILQDIAEYNGFTDYKIKIKSSHSSRSGYVCNITHTQIVTKIEDLHLIIKSCEPNDKIRTVIPMELVFKTEIRMYETVFPLFKNFEALHGLQPTQFAPTYYNSYNSKQYNALVLNDLEILGFSLHKKADFLDDVHMKLAIKRYAQLHAVSLAYRSQNFSKFNSLVESMDEFYVKVLEGAGMIEVYVNEVLKAISALDPVEDSDVKTKFEKFSTEVKQYLLSLPSTVDEFSVIAHGDSWINNLMFKYEDNYEDATPCDIRIIDFLLSRVTSPMADLASLLYSCASKEIVDDMENYLEYYYECLKLHLSSLGSDSEQLYPQTVMKNHWKQFAPYGLLRRLSTITILLSSEEEHKGFSDTIEADGNLCNVLNYHINDKEAYNDLCRHSIIHFVEKDFV